eukprot:4733149-Pyramimonas_sp.AAC.1
MSFLTPKLLKAEDVLLLEPASLERLHGRGRQDLVAHLGDALHVVASPRRAATRSGFPVMHEFARGAHVDSRRAQGGNDNEFVFVGLREAPLTF